MFKTISAVVVASAMAVSAQAQDAGSKYYVEAGLGNAMVEIDALEVDGDFGVLHLGAGYNFNRYFAVEGNLAYGITEKTYQLDGGKVKGKVDYTVGAFAVGSLPVSENVDLIGRVGLVKAQLKLSADGYSETDDDTAVALGFGVRYFPNGGLNGVRADYTYHDFDNVDSSVIQVAYVRRF
ncbi:MAG: porin family protein [Asticcacaulis sp.]